MTAWKINAAPVPADHPCLPGHFPDNPIVPGSLMLERVIDCLGQQKNGYRVSEISAAKFLSPLAPEQAFSVHFQARGESLEFACYRDEELLANGKLKLARREDRP